MKIIVGMSGGVDSTIAAYILKKKGHEVLGVNFNFTRMGEPNGEAIRTGELCEPLVELAKKLDIRIITRDYTKDFHDKIITSFVRDYESGITPNPCALCNATMKFEKLLEVMREEGADMVATGHYANICKGEPTYCIRKSDNHQKDQSYMLYRLSQDELSHIIFPLANMDKEEVRAIAKDLELPNATAKDSQDVCFIASPLDYKEFIKQFELGPDYKERIARGELSKDDIEKLPFLKKGEFVDTQGKVLGFHNGIINYTVGQRRGVNIAFGERKFVVRIDAEKNQVVLGSNEELFSDRFKIYDLVFSGYNAGAKSATRMGELCGPTGEAIRMGELRARALTKRACRAKCDKVPLGCEPVTYIAKLRYRHEGTPCDVDLSTLECRLHEPVRAITPGQSAVFYDDEGRIMFGGRIAL